MMLYAQWLKLPVATRHEVARIFKIPKTGATEVVSNEVVKDGYNIHDIEAAITTEALQTFLGSTQENFQYLWEDTIDKIEGRAPATRETITAASEEEPVKTAEDTVTIPTPPMAPVSTPEPLPPELQGTSLEEMVENLSPEGKEAYEKEKAELQKRAEEMKNDPSMAKEYHPMPTLEEQKNQKTRRVAKPRQHGKKS